MRVLLKTQSLEGQVQLDNSQHYRLLESPIVTEAARVGRVASNEDGYEHSIRQFISQTR